MSTQLTIKQETALELNELQDLSGSMSDLVQVRRTLLKPIRIKLAQKMSDSVSSSIAQPGEFVCELSGQNFGTEFSFIPLAISESASLLYTSEKPPRVMPKDIIPIENKPLCFSSDLIKNKDGILCKNCPFNEYWADWETLPSGKKVHRKCHESIDIYCIPEGTNQIAIFQLRKTSYSAGKDLVNKIVVSGKPPFYSKYTFGTVEGVNEKNQKFKKIDPLKTKVVKLSDDQILEYAPLIKSFLQARKDNLIEVDDITDDDVTDIQKNASELPI